MSPRSGSEKRKRTTIVTMRISPQEAATIRQLAQKRGESVSGLMRSALLHNRPRLARIEVQALAQLRTALGSLTGAVNKIGGNVNQAVYRLNLDPSNTAAVRLAQAIEAYQRARVIYQHLVCFDPTDSNSRAMRSASSRSPRR